MGYAVTDTSNTEADFRDVKFMTATEKFLTLRQWVRLLDSGFNVDQWAKSPRVYHHLMQHCGHIAHYDAGGFYHAQFAAPEDRVRFMTDFLRDADSGRFEWGAGADYADLNALMALALKERFKMLNALAVDAMTENRRNEVARLEREIEGLTGGR